MKHYFIGSAMCVCMIAAFGGCASCAAMEKKWLVTTLNKHVEQTTLHLENLFFEWFFRTLNDHPEKRQVLLKTLVKLQKFYEKVPLIRRPDFIKVIHKIVQTPELMVDKTCDWPLVLCQLYVNSKYKLTDIDWHSIFENTDRIPSRYKPHTKELGKWCKLIIHHAQVYDPPQTTLSNYLLSCLQDPDKTNWISKPFVHILCSVTSPNLKPAEQEVLLKALCSTAACNNKILDPIAYLLSSDTIAFKGEAGEKLLQTEPIHHFFSSTATPDDVIDAFLLTATLSIPSITGIPRRGNFKRLRNYLKAKQETAYLPLYALIRSHAAPGRTITFFRRFFEQIEDPKKAGWCHEFIGQYLNVKRENLVSSAREIKKFHDFAYELFVQLDCYLKQQKSFNGEFFVGYLDDLGPFLLAGLYVQLYLYGFAREPPSEAIKQLIPKETRSQVQHEETKYELARLLECNQRLSDIQFSYRHDSLHFFSSAIKLGTVSGSKERYVMPCASSS